MEKDIRSGIDSIIAARKKKSEALTQRQEDLKKLQGEIESQIKGIRNASSQISDKKLRDQYALAVRKINFAPLREQFYQISDRYDEAISRFTRDYISIATVGKERQGKSQFLQTVGNLDNDIIPAYSATSCTGATSVIWNTPEMGEGTVRAVITFRQPEELVSVTKAYINAIDPQYLEEENLTFERIGDIDVDYLLSHVPDGDANRREAWEHLNTIVEHFYEFRKLFGTGAITLNDPQQIKKYVAQNNGKSKDDPEVEYYYNYLAVSRADIYCRFATDTGKLRLIDTVGIGATQYGIADTMLDTVDRECDAAIVVTKPISGVQEDDLKLYNGLHDKFKRRDTRKWLFYLVNKHVGNNDNTVVAFRDEIRSKKWAAADCRIVDNSRQDEVIDGFMIPMLETLIQNMDEIDEEYLDELRQQEEALMAAMQEFRDSLPAVEGLAGPSEGIQAYQKGTECFERMATDLKNSVIYWNEMKQEKNSLLSNRVQAILNNLDDLIPTAEQINEIQRKNGHKLPQQIWEMCLHHVRNKLTDQFIAIDDVLEAENHKFKNALVKTLYIELRQMTDPDAVPADEEEAEEAFEDVDMVAWLKVMMDKYLSEKEEYVQIRKAFDFIYKFEFNTRAQLIQEVRRQLYIINPITDEYVPPNVRIPTVDCGDTVYFFLTSRMSIIEDELRYHLGKLYRTPNEAFYAAAEEFYDRLVFASDISGEKVREMQYIWGNFFQEFSTQIWKEQAQKQEQVKNLVACYESLLKVLEPYTIDKESA